MTTVTEQTASTVSGQTATTGSRHLAEALSAYGVDHVFMVPTIAVTALAEMARIGVVGVMTHDEKSAAYMADGYARVRNAPGVCMAQTVGAANLAAGLREPAMMGTPIIAITGGRDPMTKYLNVYQEIHDAPMYEPLTKLNAEIDDVRRLPDLLRQAFRTATTGRPGPVHLELRGMDGRMLDDELSPERGALMPAEARYAAVPPFRPAPADSDVRAALRVLASAERPLILAGGGVRTSGAQAELRELAEKLGIPVMTSLTGKGTLSDDHPLALGCLGGSSRPSANRACEQADVILVVGSRLGSQVTDRFRLPGNDTEIIQLDINPEELGRVRPNVVSIACDARMGLRKLVELAEPADAHATWAALTRSFVEEFRNEKESLLESAAEPMRPERLCRELSRALPEDAVLVLDTGHAGIWAAGMIDNLSSQTVLRSGGSLGWGFPAALGAKCGAPERPVVAFVGDGGFYYHLAELETAVRHGINAVIVVNDNACLGQDMKIFEKAFGGPGGEACRRMWAFEPVDLAQVAERMGCLAIRVERPDELPDALASALAAVRPVVVDVVTDVMALPDAPYGGRDFYAPDRPASN